MTFANMGESIEDIERELRIHNLLIAVQLTGRIYTKEQIIKMCKIVETKSYRDFYQILEEVLPNGI